MNDIVVYTALTCGYDELKDPPDQWHSEADCIAFTNDPNTPAGWAVRPIHDGFSDPCRNARIHKVLSHVFLPDAAYSVWMDANVVVKFDFKIEPLVARYLRNHDLAIFQHRTRKCIYQEAVACIAAHKDSPEVIRRQMEKYFAESYPRNNGLVESCVILRRHTEQIKHFNELWHKELVAHSRRDQLSFNYVAHKLGLGYEFLPGDMSRNAYFEWKPHKAASMA
jgi:hypothetical protein